MFFGIVQKAYCSYGLGLLDTSGGHERRIYWYNTEWPNSLGNIYTAVFRHRKMAKYSWTYSMYKI